MCQRCERRLLVLGAQRAEDHRQQEWIGTVGRERIELPDELSIVREEVFERLHSVVRDVAVFAAELGMATPVPAKLRGKVAARNALRSGLPSADNLWNHGYFCFQTKMFGLGGRV